MKRPYGLKSESELAHPDKFNNVKPVRTGMNATTNCITILSPIYRGSSTYDRIAFIRRDLTPSLPYIRTNILCLSTSVAHIH